MKTTTTVLCLLLATCFTYSAFSQGWEKSYGGAKDDIACDVIKTSDGGFVAVGYTESFGGGGKDVFIVKINSSGVLKWTRVFGGAGNDIAYSVAQTTSGDLIIAGVTGSSGAGGNDVYLIRLTANGATKWTKTFGSTGNDEARSVLFSGTSFYVAGTTTLTGTSNSNFYLVKTDGNGNLVWEKNYGSGSSENAFAMVKTFDGGFALAGLTTGFGSNRVYIVKVNAAGDTLFTRNFSQGTQSPGATGITETTDHGLAMTGFNYSGSGYGDMFLMKVSSTGSLVFSQIGTALSNSGSNLAALNDGGVIVVGNYCNFGCTMELLKYNSAGTELWHRPGYQAANSNSYATFSGGNAIKTIGNSSYIACGYTYLPSGTNTDFLIVKTDTSGNSYTPPVFSYNGPTTFCIPGSVTMTAPLGYVSYQWTYVSPSHSLSYISGATTASYTASAKGNYSCIMKSASNDVNIAYANINAVVASAPVITTSGSPSFCSATGQTLLLSTYFDYGYNYQWKLNGINISGATNSGYYPTSSGNYSVVLTNTCGTFTSSNLAVDVAGPPTVPVISYSNGGFLQVVQCNGYDHSYYGYIQVPQVSGATYQWHHNGTLLSGATNYSTFPYFNNENYTCTVTTPCGSATSVPFPATYNVFGVVSPPLQGDGPTEGCGVTSVTLSSYWAQGSYYQWYYNYSPIPGATSYSYLATASGYYYLEYDDYDCGLFQTQGISVYISTYPAPAISAVGSTSVCTGAVTLNATPTGAGVTYQWYKDNVPIGATASAYAAATTGNYKCYVTQPCGSMFSNAIYISTGVPVNDSIITNKINFCANDSATLSILSSAPGQTYFWKRNGTIIPGATSSSYFAHLAGNYVCRLTNTCGTVSSNTISLTVKTLPASSITAGNTVICAGDSVALTANAGAGLTYQWFRFNYIYTIYGATQQSYYPTTASLYGVRVTGSNGCTATSSQVTTTSAVMPVVSVVSYGYPVICANESVTLKATTGAGFTYQWKKNGANITGATDSVYAASEAGTYSVSVTNICGSVTAQAPYAVQTKNLPLASITPQGPTTFCAGGSVLLNANTGTGFTYKWKKNGANISGATASSYTATTAGTYKVAVTNNNSCSKTSAGTVVTVPCREGENLSASASLDIKAVIYPNPFNEFFELYIEDDADKKYSAIIMDITGKVIKRYDNIVPGSEIQLGENLVAGCYFVDVISNEKKKTLKVVKL